MSVLTKQDRDELSVLLARAKAIKDRAKAPVVSRLKAEKKVRDKAIDRSRAEQRQPRVEEPAYLAWLRLQPCCVGPLMQDACQGRTDPAHIRFSDYSAGRINPGKAAKSDDKWCLPVCRKHHDAQHAYGNERRWWSAEVGADPTKLAIEHHERFSAETQLRKARA